MSGLFDSTTQGLARSLDMRLLRHNLTTANVANAETPGYAAKKVDFEDSLSTALQNADAPSTNGEANPISSLNADIMGVQGDVYDNPDVNHSNDGNTVDMEKEMSNLAENTVLYRAAVELIKKKLGAMRYVASEGGR
jgi:flagellar basal-body rod protein FlgB